MKHMKLNCGIWKLFCKSLWAAILIVLSLGFATPWILRYYLTFITSNIVCEDGSKIIYKDDKPSQLFLKGWIWLLLTIVTLGIFSLFIFGQIIVYAVSNIEIETNGKTYIGKKYANDFGKDFYLSIAMIGFAILGLISLGFAIPYGNKFIYKTILNSYFIFYDKENEYEKLICKFKMSKDEKEEYVKQILLNHLLIFATITLYTTQAEKEAFNMLLAKTNISIIDTKKENQINTNEKTNDESISNDQDLNDVAFREKIVSKKAAKNIDPKKKRVIEIVAISLITAAILMMCLIPLIVTKCS